MLSLSPSINRTFGRNGMTVAAICGELLRVCTCHREVNREGRGGEVRTRLMQRRVDVHSQTGCGLHLQCIGAGTTMDFLVGHWDHLKSICHCYILPSLTETMIDYFYKNYESLRFKNLFAVMKGDD